MFTKLFSSFENTNKKKKIKPRNHATSSFKLREKSKLSAADNDRERERESIEKKKTTQPNQSNPHKISRPKKSLSRKMKKRMAGFPLPVGTTPNADKKEQPLKQRSERRKH